MSSVYFVRWRDDVDLDDLRMHRKVYLKWLNSLGGISYGLFTASQLRQTSAISSVARFVDTVLPQDGAYLADQDVLSKATRDTLSAGKDFITAGELADLYDLASSIDVAYYDPDTGAFVGCVVSGSPAIAPAETYNEFSIEITFNEKFGQIR